MVSQISYSSPTPTHPTVTVYSWTVIVAVLLHYLGDRQTDRQTDKQTLTHTHTHIHTQTHTHTHCQRDGQLATQLYNTCLHALQCAIIWWTLTFTSTMKLSWSCLQLTQTHLHIINTQYTVYPVLHCVHKHTQHNESVALHKIKNSFNQ